MDHIGSTSVPNLSAKDVIDIQITVTEFAPAISEALQAAGFIALPAVTADHVPQLFLLPGARHYVQMDEPDEVARLILTMPLASSA